MTTSGSLVFQSSFSWFLFLSELCLAVPEPEPELSNFVNSVLFSFRRDAVPIPFMIYSLLSKILKKERKKENKEEQVAVGVQGVSLLLRTFSCLLPNWELPVLGPAGPTWSFLPLAPKLRSHVSGWSL